MVAPLRGGDCRHTARASDQTLGFEPFPAKKNRPAIAGLWFLAGGEGWSRRCAAATVGTLRVPRIKPWGSNLFPPKKIGPRLRAYGFWLGERDSNPRWRSQSPQSYR